jgi:hypothetical protein
MRSDNYEQEVEQSADDEQTLPGLGPRLGMEHLRRGDEPSCSGEHAREMTLNDEEQAVLDMMGAQIKRYDWFAERVEGTRSITELAAVLLRSPRGPGRWEQALVELSVRDDMIAHTLIEQWMPPADDPELALFHQVCVTRARRRTASPKR